MKVSKPISSQTFQDIVIYLLTSSIMRCLYEGLSDSNKPLFINYLKDETFKEDIRKINEAKQTQFP